MVPECELCRGRGWTVELDAGAGTARQCRCQGERSLAERLAAAGVWEEYLHCTRDAWRGTWPAAKLAGFGVTQHLCTIFGPVWCGKTHLATAILGEWLAAGGRGRWQEVSTMLEELKDAMATGRGGLLEQVRSGRCLLVLDGLLNEQATDWTEFVLSHILRYRHGRHLPTVITASARDLVELNRIAPRLSSRCAAGIVIGLTGANRRTARGVA